MADEKDHHVAGPPEEFEREARPGADAESKPAQPAGPSAPVPSAEPASSEPPADVPAAHGAPPPPGARPGPPQGPPQGPPHAPYGTGGGHPGPRRWTGSRPVQLVAAGLIGAIIGGGAVAVLDLLDDGHDRGYHHYMPYGPGYDDGDGGYRRYWHGPGDGPMMPGPRDGWPRQYAPPAPAPQPSAPAPTPSP